MLSAADRVHMFRETFDWNETQALLIPLQAFGEAVEVAFGAPMANRLMRAAAHLLDQPLASAVDWSSLEIEDTEDWREMWSDLHAKDDTVWSPLLEDTHDLHCFAYFGVLPIERPTAPDRKLDVLAWALATVERLKLFMARIPRGSSGDAYLDELDRLCKAAIGRVRLDAGESIDVHQLAALSRVTVKRLQNAIYNKTDTSPIVTDGVIAPASAHRWLESHDFLPSLWREQLTGEHAAIDDGTPEDDVGDFVFVPEASDGTLFGPSRCLRDGKDGTGPAYTIGSKSQERRVASYEAALAELARMKTPSWRRKNDVGNYGIVVAQRWVRLSKAELSAI